MCGHATCRSSGLEGSSGKGCRLLDLVQVCLFDETFGDRKFRELHWPSAAANLFSKHSCAIG
jgi:hypothetical protein